MHDLERIRRTLAHLKHPADFDPLPRLPGGDGCGTPLCLRPVPAELKGEARSDARLMAEWRNAERSAFFTWITVTEESTRAWITETYGPDDEDILFMVESPVGSPFGHLALSNFQENGAVCEFGRVLRGPGLGPRGGMTLGAFALLSWAVSDLGVQKVFLEVFRENGKAISLYDRLGFREAGILPLRRVDHEECTRWEKVTEEEEGLGGEVHGYAVRMEVTAGQLRAPERG